jgi:hypothetical protein
MAPIKLFNVAWLFGILSFLSVTFSRLDLPGTFHPLMVWWLP